MGTDHIPNPIPVRTNENSAYQGQPCKWRRQLNQWRRQDLLREGAKIEIMSWDNHGGLRGRVQQLLDD